MLFAFWIFVRGRGAVAWRLAIDHDSLASLPWGESGPAVRLGLLNDRNDLEIGGSGIGCLTGLMIAH